MTNMGLVSYTVERISTLHTKIKWINEDYYNSKTLLDECSEKEKKKVRWRNV